MVAFDAVSVLSLPLFSQSRLAHDKAAATGRALISLAVCVAESGWEIKLQKRTVVPFGEEKTTAAVCISKYESIEKSSLGLPEKKKCLSWRE